jgi:Ca2+:H+ antiporter
MAETPVDATEPPERREGAARRWTWAVPLVAWGLIGAEHAGLVPGTSLPFVAIAAVAICAAVFAAVAHAETVAARVGETAGVVILGLAVTTIEVSLIAAMMFGTPADATTVARNTVFAGVMVVVNGVGGLSLLIGGLRHHEQRFRLQGTASALGVLGTLAVVTMILPDYTVSEPSATFSPVQLVFVAVSSLLLIGFFLFAQTVSHRDQFAEAEAAAAPQAPVAWPTALMALAMLAATLAAVVLLADDLAPTVQRGVAGLGLPQECAGVVVAALVLLPEGTSAVRAAKANRIQTSLNLALGSAIQSTGLTIPAIALLSLALDAPITLGLAPEHVVLLALTLFISTLTLSTGRTTVLQGAVHLVIFAVFLVIAAVP